MAACRGRWANARSPGARGAAAAGLPVAGLSWILESNDAGHVVRSVSQRCASVRGNLRLSASTARAELTEESPMTLFVFAALTTVAAAIWVITAPQSPQDPTMDEFSRLIALGFIP